MTDKIILGSIFILITLCVWLLNNVSRKHSLEIEELKRKSEGELEKRLADVREKFRTVKFNLAAGKVKSVKELHEAKKEVARILTFLGQRSDNDARGAKK